MNFCAVCENMMFCTLPTDQGIQYVCRCCGSDKNTTDPEEDVAGDAPARKTHCVYSRVVKETVASKSELLLSNPHIALDPTLPRRQLKCFNDQCKNTEITIVRLDDSTLEYLCYCDVCKTKWSKETEL